MLYLIFCLFFIIIICLMIYEEAKHTCEQHLSKKIKDIKQKDDYYILEFYVLCKVCGKVKRTEYSKIKNFKIK